jgi:hypothetical protein
MGVVNTTYTFTSTDTITSAKMNNIIDETTFTSDAIQGTTLQVVSPGKLAVSAGGITSNELASNSVVTAAITDSNVTTAKIADSAITTAKIANSAVTTVKIADGNVTLEKLSGTSGTRPVQIIQSVKYDIQTIDTDATSWVDITSLSATITRISTISNHRIQAVINNSSNDGNNFLMFRVLRGTTPIGLGNADGNRVRITSGGGYAQSYNITASCIDFIDDTSGVSDASLTYKIQARIYSIREGYINRALSDSNVSDYVARAISTLTITELG